MEADVLLVADKRYVQKEDKKHFLKVLQHTAIFGHPSILSGLGAVVTSAVVAAAAWLAADRKYLAIAAAACCVAFFLPVVLELFFVFDVVSFGIEAVRVLAFCEKDMFVGCFQVLVVCSSGIDVSCEFESEQHCSAAAASECVFALEHDWEAGHRLASSPAEGTGEQATGRVDVPGEAHNGIFEQKVAAASLTAAWQHTPVLTARCVGSLLEKVGKRQSSISNLCS